MSAPIPPSAPKPGRRLLRWLRRLAVAVGVLLGLLALVVALVLLVAPVRERVLVVALSRANDALPGEITAGEMRWPSPGRVLVRDLVWTDGGDTLVTASTVAVSVRLGALRGRSLSLRDVAVEGLVADLPAVQGRFPAAAPPEPGTPPRRAFLRRGSLSGIPSIGVDRFAISGPRVRVSETLTLRDLVLVGSADLLAGGEPGVRVDTARVRSDGEPGWAIQEAALRLDPVRARLAADVGALVAGKAFRLRVQDPGDGRFTMELHGEDVLDVRLDGSLERRGLQPVGVDAVLTGSVTAAGRTLDGIDLHAAVPARGDVLVDGAFVVEGLTVRLDAAATRGEPLVVHLAPIEVVEGRAPARRIPARRAPRDGEIRFQPETGAIQADGLRVTGALGRLTVNGTWTREKTGTFKIDAEWPEPPVPLRRALAARGVPVDVLRERWVADGPFRIRLAGTAAAREAAYRIVADGDFRLPGPRTLRPFLPPGARVEDLGAIRAKVNLDVLTTRTVPDGRFDLDLGATDWIDTGRIRVRSREGRAEIDTLRLTLEGISAGVRGWLEADALALDGEFDLTDMRFLERLLGDGAEGLQAAASGRFSAGGSPRDPRGEASFTARGSRGDLVVEGVSGRVARDGAGVRAELETTGPVRSGPMVLDRIRATAAAPLSLESFQVMLDASAAEFAVYLRSGIRRGDPLVLDVDSLRVRLQDQSLATRAGFRAEIDPATRRLALDGLQMSGGLGTLDASGFAGADSTDLRAQVGIDLPPRPAFVTVPDGLWPGRIEASVRALGREELEASARVSGLSLPGSPDLGVHLSGESKDHRFSARVEVLGNGAARVLGQVRVPGRVSLYPFVTELEEGPLSGEVTLEGAPVPFSMDPDTEETPIGKLDGRLVLGGTTGDPQAGGSIALSFPDWPKLARHGAELMFLFRGKAAPDTAVAATVAPELAAAGSGLRTRFGVRGGDRVLLTGRADLPLVVSLLTGKAVVPEGVPIEARVEATDFPLGDLNPFLPGNAGIDGTCTLRLDAHGPARDPALDGRLSLRKTTVSLADGSRAAARGDLTLGGTGQRPDLRGKIEVQSGVIRVPEQQRALLPSSGDSKLWEVEPYRPEIVDSAAVPAGPAAPAAPSMDLDVTVTIPSGLYIQGRGLDLELAGDLRLVQRGNVPTVSGELKAVRGTLNFLGRRFTVDRGVVTFYGGDTVDPALDLMLSARVGEETIRILVAGTAQEPDLTLESDSGLTEGDIMAVILFGAPLDKLDSSQTRSLAGEVAKSIAASRLEASVASQLGVDMITVTQGRSEQESLIVGKYITRRALLKYEQALRSTGTFFLNLEYTLTRTLKLETLYGSDSQNAIELNWGREY